MLPASIFAEVFELADRAGRSNLPDIPTLALISEGDDTASPGATRKFLRRAGGEKTRIEIFHRSNHVLMVDYDREKAIDSIVDFLTGFENGRPGELLPKLKLQN